jgi:aryl-alcohol dehydrogenase-like predicted oxidoreductase
LAAKIGISVYYGRQIDTALDRYPIEIVQLPFNPLDRRLIDGGQIGRLASAGVEIHARSLFLQGLLLQDADALEPRFGPLRAAIGELHEWSAAAGLTWLEGVVALALRISEIDRFIVGVTSERELQEIVNAAKVAEGMQELPSFASSRPLDQRHLDPSRWGELGQPDPTFERTSQ